MTNPLLGAAAFAHGTELQSGVEKRDDPVDGAVQGFANGSTGPLHRPQSKWLAI